MNQRLKNDLEHQVQRKMILLQKLLQRKLKVLNFLIYFLSLEDADAAPAISDKDAPQFIINYLQEQNRPFNAVNLFENLHRRVKRASLNRLLIELSEKGKIMEKVFGKNKFYFACQDQYGEIKEEELNSLDEQIEELKDQYTSQHSEVSKLDNEVNSLKNAPTTVDLEKSVNEMTERIKSKLERLKVLEETQGNIPEGTHEKLSAELKKYIKLWNERKRNVIDTVELMADGLEKDKSELFEVMGIEDDEMYNVDLKEMRNKYVN